MEIISIFVGSVYGNAEAVADAVATQIKSLGHQAEVFTPGELSNIKTATHLLFITSTTGTGDLPDELQALYQTLKSEFPLLTNVPYGVITLGDSSYGDSYCGAGIKLNTLLEELQAKPLLPMLKIDACEDFEPEIPALKWLAGYLKAF